MNFERSTAGVISTDIDKYREVKARKKLTQKNNSLENTINELLETNQLYKEHVDKLLDYINKN